jgi:hypothetical protein
MFTAALETLNLILGRAGSRQPHGSTRVTTKLLLKSSITGRANDTLDAAAFTPGLKKSSPSTAPPSATARMLAAVVVAGARAQVASFNVTVVGAAVGCAVGESVGVSVGVSVGTAVGIAVKPLTRPTTIINRAAPAKPMSRTIGATFFWLKPCIYPARLHKSTAGYCKNVAERGGKQD